MARLPTPLEHGSGCQPVIEKHPSHTLVRKMVLESAVGAEPRPGLNLNVCQALRGAAVIRVVSTVREPGSMLQIQVFLRIPGAP